MSLLFFRVIKVHRERRVVFTAEKGRLTRVGQFHCDSKMAVAFVSVLLFVVFQMCTCANFKMPPPFLENAQGKINSYFFMCVLSWFWKITNSRNLFRRHYEAVWSAMISIP